MTYKEKLEKALVALVEQWNPEAKIYAVGGYVRDEIMENRMHDLDVVIDLEGNENPAVSFVDFLKNNKIKDTSGYTVYPKFGTAKFDLQVGHCSEAIECVMPRSERYEEGPRKPSEVKKTTLEIDASRRDFCCNALYKDLKTGKILDPTGKGLDDIKSKILRTPLDPKETFKDDPLRMLRAIRFAAKLEFKISDEVLAEIKPIPEYLELSMERVRDEFQKIITSSKPSKYIWMIHEAGLLRYIVPELEDAWGFNQNSKYHSMNLTDHILAVLDGTRHASGRSRVGMPDSPYVVTLSWAALLHDISKYKEYQVKDDGSFSYHGHEVSSAVMAESILRRLKCSEKQISDVSKLIRDHMIIKQFYDYSKDCYTGSKKYTRKVLSKYPDTKELSCLLALIDADNKAHGEKWCMPGQVQSFYEAVDALKGLPSLSTLHASFNSPIGGDDIISRYGLKSGKQIGEIKDMIKELYLDNPSLSKENLFLAYEAEFKDKTVWVWKSRFGKEHISIIEPKLLPANGIFKTGYEVDNFIDALELDEGESYLESGQMIKKLDAIEYPNLYTRYRIFRRSRELVDKILDIMEEFHQMPNFKSITVGLDYTNDAFGSIEWRNHRTDYIL